MFRYLILISIDFYDFISVSIGSIYQTLKLVFDNITKNYKKEEKNITKHPEVFQLSSQCLELRSSFEFDILYTTNTQTFICIAKGY